MARDAYSAATNEPNQDIRHRQEATPPETSDLDALRVSPEEYQILDSIQHRMLWLCTLRNLYVCVAENRRVFDTW